MTRAEMVERVVGVLTDNINHYLYVCDKDLAIKDVAEKIVDRLLGNHIADASKKVEPEKPVCANCIHHATDDTRCLTCQGEYFRAKEKPVTRKEALEISKKVMDDAESARIAKDKPIYPTCSGFGYIWQPYVPEKPAEIEELEITSNNENEFEMVTKINELVRAVNKINKQGGGR